MFRGTSNLRRYKPSLGKQMQLIMVLFVSQPPVHRSVWMFPRSDNWFEIVLMSLPQSEWYANFRVSKETFNYIMSEITGDIPRKNTKMHRAVSSQKRLAITLYYIGLTSEYRTVANLFGVSTAFVCVCIKGYAWQS